MNWSTATHHTLDVGPAHRIGDTASTTRSKTISPCSRTAQEAVLPRHSFRLPFPPCMMSGSPIGNNLVLQVMNQGRGAYRKAVVQLHSRAAVPWACYAGKNFTDRQRIKRKAES